MPSHPSAEVWTQLRHAQDLARLISDEPLTTRRVCGSPFRARLLRRRHTVATVTDPALVEFLERAPRKLFALAEALSAVLGEHGDTDGTCATCRQAAPCRTRRLVANHLVRGWGDRVERAELDGTDDA